MAGEVFKKHYTREEAEKLLPEVRVWLARLRPLRTLFEEDDARLTQLLAQGDVGGPTVHRWLRTLVDMQEILREFHSRDIQLKDLDRGLLDFPAYVSGKEVFLCWEEDEDKIEFWHDMNSGYASRERL